MCHAGSRRIQLAILADKNPKESTTVTLLTPIVISSSLTEVFLPSFSTYFFIITRYVCIPTHHRYSDLVKDSRRKGQGGTDGTYWSVLNGISVFMR